MNLARIKSMALLLEAVIKAQMVNREIRIIKLLNITHIFADDNTILNANFTNFSHYKII